MKGLNRVMFIATAIRAELRAEECLGPLLIGDFYKAML